jgi:predicted molibdopterin-dependent oxidoreductase YjgC
MMREGLGTERIDTPAHLNNLAVIETMTDVFGIPASRADLADIDGADLILIVDSNIVNSHPVAALEALRVYHSGAAKVLVMGHRSNKLTTQCTHFARTVPGSEAALLNYLAGYLMEHGGLDEAELQQRTEGYDALKAHAAQYKLAEVADQSGVNSSVIADMAEAVAGAEKLLLVLSPGSLHSSMNSSIARAAANLVVLKNGNVLSLLHEGNAQGALDMGVSPDFLPGYKETTGTQGGSLEAAEILRAVEAGDIKALYLLGGDIRKEMALLGVPEDALDGLELLIVQDVLASPIAEKAHVALPACSFAEREASYTNTYRTLQKTGRAVQPLGNSRPDAEILAELGNKLGLAKVESLESLRAQLVSAVPMYDALKGEAGPAGDGGWDYSKVNANAKQRLSVVRENKETSDDAYPFRVTFDTALHYGGSTSLHSPALAKIRTAGSVEISGKDAVRLGVEDGATVELKVKDGGAATIPVCISRELPAGVVNVPTHNVGIIQNLISKLEPAALKPESGAPVWFAGIQAGKGK